MAAEFRSTEIGDLPVEWEVVRLREAEEERAAADAELAAVLRLLGL